VALAGAAVTAAAMVLAGCAGTGSKSGPSGGDIGYVAGQGGAQVFKPGDRKKGPSASGTTLSGSRASLAQYRGKVLVVNFWASWCAPCRGEAPTFAQLATSKAGEGVQFLGVDIKDSKAGAQAFERTFSTPYPSIFDPDGSVTLDFRVVPPSAVPSTLILDRQGRVAVRIITQTSYSVLSPLIDRVAGEKP
jgi:thiol-disulfide isomerase/thioredoxin